mmetsp:Transcript_62452/g.108920  ORF Transcript_62452/g.108920 Transcript_62452/m.108920 type:complete len:553 (+) Transcript_62452:66-1724(+)
MLGWGGSSRQQAVTTWAMAASGAGMAVLFLTVWRTVLTRIAAQHRRLIGSDDKHRSDSKAAASGIPEDGDSDEQPAPDLEDIAADARPERLGTGEVRRRFKSPEMESRETSVAPEASSDHLPGAQKVYVRTFGCPHNASDGEYMMGQLREYGYTLVDTMEDCDVCVVNSCTVKHPSETRAMNLVTNGKSTGKAVVLAGCVPSSDKRLAESLEGVSMLDVTQLDRIVEVVEESVKGHTVKLLEKRTGLPSLALPKVRKDKFAEIITINAGCLGSCTFCKTKSARGKVVSYPIPEIVARAKQAAAEGVCQIELASEDMGAYGIDIGTNIVELLLQLSDALPPGVMLRTGMTNPPYIMYHIDGVIEALKRPNVHSFMHIPVQSGSDNVLLSMRREYTCAEFCYLLDKLKEAIPDIFLLSDIICAFPAESEEDWQATMALCRKYKFQGLHVSQFYARPGTPAARLPRLQTNIGKERWRECTDFVHSYNRNEALEGRAERVWFSGTEEAHNQTVGRTKNFAKVVVPRDDSLLGRNAMVLLGSSNRFHVEGKVIGDLC